MAIHIMGFILRLLEAMALFGRFHSFDTGHRFTFDFLV